MREISGNLISLTNYSSIIYKIVEKTLYSSYLHGESQTKSKYSVMDISIYPISLAQQKIS